MFDLCKDFESIENVSKNKSTPTYPYSKFRGNVSETLRHDDAETSMKAISHGREGTDHFAVSEQVPAGTPDALVDAEGVLDGMFIEMAEHVGLSRSTTHELSAQMFDALVAQQLGRAHSR